MVSLCPVLQRSEREAMERFVANDDSTTEEEDSKDGSANGEGRKPISGQLMILLNLPAFLIMILGGTSVSRMPRSILPLACRCDP